jgi:tRNA(Ile2) C34 agmatinyltransferase TiaS
MIFMVLICPQCGKAALYLETGGVMGDIYRCKNCTYIGNFVIESDDEELSNELREGHRAETGKF